MALVRSETWREQDLLKASSYGFVSPGRTVQQAGAPTGHPSHGQHQPCRNMCLGQRHLVLRAGCKGALWGHLDVPKAACAGH